MLLFTLDANEGSLKSEEKKFHRIIPPPADDLMDVYYYVQ